MSILAMVMVILVFQSIALAATEEKVAITITAKDRSIGSPSAPVLMVEYAPPTCQPGACFDLDVLPLLKTKYIDTGRVYYVFRVGEFR